MGALGKFLLAVYRLIKAGVKKDDILKFAQREFGQVTPLLRKQIDKIVKRRDLPKTKKKGEVVPFKKEGIMETSKATDVLSKVDRTRLGYPNRKIEGMVRTAAREILMKKGIDIGRKDPIEVLRMAFGDDALAAVDNIAEGLMDVTDYKTLGKRLEAEGLYKLKAKPKAEYDEAVKSGEDFRKLDEFDPTDREPNASGGVAGLLGERTGYKNGEDVTAAEIRRKERIALAKKVNKYIKPRVQFDEKGNRIPTFSKTGPQQVEGAPEGATSDKEFTNFIMSLDIPITEKIDLLGDFSYGKFRDKQEYEDKMYLHDPKSWRERKVGIGYNWGTEGPEEDGLSGYLKYDIDRNEPEAWMQFSKPIDFHKLFSRKADGGIAGMLGEPTYADQNTRVPYQTGALVDPRMKNTYEQNIAQYADPRTKSRPARPVLKPQLQPQRPIQPILKPQRPGGGGQDLLPVPRPIPRPSGGPRPAPFDMNRPGGGDDYGLWAIQPGGGQTFHPQTRPTTDAPMTMMRPSGPPSPALGSTLPAGPMPMGEDPMMTGFDYSKEVNWSPGQAAPPGYRVVNKLGDTWIEPMYPSKKEMAMMPSMAGPMPMGLLMPPSGNYADNFNQGGRVSLGGGKLVFDAARRKFLQMMGGAAAGTAAAKTGLFGLLKAGKPVVKELTSVPIKAGVDGMPVWFKPLVNKVIKEGDDVSKKFATGERQIVHQSTLPDSKTNVLVTQDLTSGNVTVDVGMGKHGFAAGHHGQPARLEYKAAEDIMTGPDADDLWKIGERDPHVKTKTKTKEEFWVDEAEFTGGHPENIKFEEFSSEKFGQHGSNFDEVEKFATGTVKKKTAKESIKAERAHWVPEGDDMASGGRVPLGGGKLVLEGLAKLFFKKKPTTLKEFIEKRQFLKNMMGNTTENEKKRILAKILEESKKVKGYKFPDVGEGSDIHKEIEMLLSKDVTKHAEGGRVSLSAGGLAGMLGE